MTVGTYLVAALISLLYCTVNARYSQSAYLMYPFTFATAIHLINKIQDSTGDYFLQSEKGKTQIKTDMLVIIFALV